MLRGRYKPVPIEQDVERKVQVARTKRDRDIFVAYGFTY